MDDAGTLLEVENLRVEFDTLERTRLRVVDRISLAINRRETVGIVGESGSGKTVTAMSIMRLLEEPPAHLQGAIHFYPNHGEEPVDLLKLDPQGARMRSIRGKEIAMIFQEPMRALSPVFTVGHQVAEAVWLHQPVSRREAHRQAIQMIGRVGIPDPERHARQHPHELSGGQRQRVMIAMALVCRPKLLIADEPTTALDVTIQAQILDLLRDLQDELDLAVCLITHDLGIVAQNCRRVNVMYLGKIVESADVTTIFKQPAHPYTQGLIKSVPVPCTGHKSRLRGIRGVVPNPDDVPPGCPFGPRCDHFVAGICDRPEDVQVVSLSDDHWVRCHRAKE